jgi:quercetin dioxygenase-like cupin family protein
MAEQPLLDPGVARCLSLPVETRFVPEGIVSRTLLRAPGLRVVLFGFAAGQELSEHTSPYQALVQGLSGEADFRVNGDAYRLKAGDLLSMPPHAPHSLTAVTEFSMLLTLAPVVVPVQTPVMVPGGGAGTGAGGLPRLPVSGSPGQ